MSDHDGWDELAEAALTHDLARERAAWAELTCVTCRDPAIPGEHLCAEHYIASAQRRAEQERPAPYRRWFGAA